METELPPPQSSKVPTPRLPNTSRCVHGSSGRTWIFLAQPRESHACPSSRRALGKSSMDDKFARQKATEHPPLYATRSTNCCNVLLEEVVEIRGSMATWNKNSISPRSTAWSC